MPPPGASKVDGSGSWLTALISGLVMGVPSGGDEGVLFAFVLSLQERKKKREKVLGSAFEMSLFLSLGMLLKCFPLQC